MKLVEYIKNPKLHFLSFIYRKFGKLLPDKFYLKLLFYLRVGKSLNLNNPKTYREKIQWLKLYDRKPLYTKLVDKYLVKDYVSEIIGPNHIIPTIGVWDNTDDINFDCLPEKFVLKCNHNSHCVVICKNKKILDIKNTINKLNDGLLDDYYIRGREWAYKNVCRRIIAEQYIDDNSKKEGCLTDYKYFCFGGKAKIMYISHDIADDPRTDFFDINFKHLDIKMQDENSINSPQKPKFFYEMRNAAEQLTKGIPFARVDFYSTEETYYFGEITFYPSAGFAPIYPEKWDYIIGSWIELPKN